MFLDQLYMTGLGKIAYGAIYTPTAFFLAAALAKPLLRPVRTRWGRLLGMLLIFAALLSVPLWDVLAITYEAKQLCQEQAGIRVKRMVEANGFLAGAAAFTEYQADHGYTYVERPGPNGKKFRSSMQDGRIVEEEVPNFVSRYELKTSTKSVALGKHFVKSSSLVVTRETGEVLGQMVVIAIFPGIWDQVVLSVTGTGSGFKAWTCGDKPPVGKSERLTAYDLVWATIKPQRAIQGESK